MRQPWAQAKNTALLFRHGGIAVKQGAGARHGLPEAFLLSLGHRLGTGAGKTVGMHEAAVLHDAEIQMGTGGRARGTHKGHNFALIHLLADLEDFRKLQSGVKSAGEGENGADGIFPDVEPLGRTGEMSEAKYARRRRRSRRVSIMSGTVGVLVFMIAIFVFLWNYWLKDIFSTAERVELPNFVGQNYESVVNDNANRSLFDFTVTYSIDPNVPEGQIISQDPEAGRSLMIVPEGIEVTLTVSTGVRESVVPDVLNKSLQEAIVELQNSGFKYEPAYSTSNEVTEGYVISTDPAPGGQLAEGSTVIVTISSGPELRTITMPNLVGYTEDEAINILYNNNLAYADTTYIESEQAAGTVIRQSIEAYEDVEEHTRIYLWVSTGPAETPAPTPTPTPPTQTPGEEFPSGETYFFDW